MKTERLAPSEAEDKTTQKYAPRMTVCGRELVGNRGHSSHREGNDDTGGVCPLKLPFIILMMLSVPELFKN